MQQTYYKPGGGLPHLASLADAASDAAAIESVTRSPMFWIWNVGHLAAVPTLAYHGYKRNDSVGWALVWGILGSFVWPVTVPIAFAQGYAKRHVRPNRRRRTSRRTSRRRGR